MEVRSVWTLSRVSKLKTKRRRLERFLTIINVTGKIQRIYEAKVKTEYNDLGTNSHFVDGIDMNEVCD